MKVCIVDDDIAYTYLVKFLIREADATIDIITFPDGDLGLEFITANINDAASLPDIILLDINMPRMDGWGFLKGYKAIADKAAKPIAIYMLSSSISEADMAKAGDEPLLTEYIVKPLGMDRFAEIKADFESRPGV